MLRIALVEYINTRPFLDGLESYFRPDEVQLLTMPPSACGMALREQSCDLALIPLGSLPELPEMEILPNYCIGSNGEVASVFVFSQKPLDQCKHLILDPHSRSSNGLTRILMAHHWHVQPQMELPVSRDFSRIQGDTAGVVIGDQAIRIRDQYAYVYDLSLAWQEMTGLPFAFAVWAAPKGKLDVYWRQRLNQAFKLGVQSAAESAKKWAHKFELEADFAHQYLTQYIDYQFTASKHQAMQLYLKLLHSLSPIETHELHHI